MIVGDIFMTYEQLFQVYFIQKQHQLSTFTDDLQVQRKELALENRFCKLIFFSMTVRKFKHEFVIKSFLEQCKVKKMKVFYSRTKRLSEIKTHSWTRNNHCQSLGHICGNQRNSCLYEVPNDWVLDTLPQKMVSCS